MKGERMKLEMIPVREGLIHPNRYIRKISEISINNIPDVKNIFLFGTLILVTSEFRSYNLFEVPSIIDYEDDSHFEEIKWITEGERLWVNQPNSYVILTEKYNGQIYDHQIVSYIEVLKALNYEATIFDHYGESKLFPDVLR